MRGLGRKAGPARRVPRIALATCRQLPAGDEDSGPLLAACSAAGLDAEWRIWDDPAVDWGSYDLVVIRATWDYAPRRDDFAAWAASVPRLANPAEVVAWNTDKTYLRELAAAGVPVVPTAWLAPGAPVDWPDWPDLVVKPTVSAGSQDTARYGPDEQTRPARTPTGCSPPAGRSWSSRTWPGWTPPASRCSCTSAAATATASARRRSCGPARRPRPTRCSGRSRSPSGRRPRPSGRWPRRRWPPCRAVPARLLYARVDLLPDEAGDPVVIELELTEPSLWLSSAPGAADRLAGAIRTVVRP